MKKNRFNYLIERYKQNSLSQEEYSELIKLLNKPDSEENLDQILTQYWEEIGEILSSKQKTPVRPHVFTHIDSAHLLPHRNHRSLDDRSNLTTPRRHSSTTPHLNDSTSQPLLWWGIAASFLLVAGAFFYFWGSTEILGKPELVYSTGFGERLEIDLDDGSHVTLNANSELRWSDDWEKSEDRQVILTGEAFFEVKKQNGIPFTVNTNDVAIEVLGTSFNVDSREEKTEVYLDEGEVNLKLKNELIDENNSEEKQILMKPGDQVRYSATEKIIEKSEGQDMISAASWKKNVLNFKDMPFSEVLEMLREIYGQSFECNEGGLLKKPMVIGVPYSDWEAVRQALELTLNIEFQKMDTRRYVVRSIKK